MSVLSVISWVFRHSIQLYLSIMFILLGVINVPPYDIPLPVPVVWPSLLSGTGVIVAATLIAPLSKSLFVAAQSAIIFVSTSRSIALFYVASTEEMSPSLLTGTLVWGLVIIIGWKFDDITLRASAFNILQGDSTLCPVNTEEK